MVIVEPALSTLGALGAAIASFLCCTGPLLYVGLAFVLLFATFPAWSTWLL